MQRMSNHEYDLQYRRHMDKLQRQAQYISDLMRYASIQDEAHAPHNQYHRKHNSVPPAPRQQHSYYPEQVEKNGPYVPAKPQQKPLKSILRRTEPTNVTEMPARSPTPPPLRKRPVSANQLSTSPIPDNVRADGQRRVRIQGAHHTSRYARDVLPEDEDDYSIEEQDYDRRFRANNDHRYESDSEEDQDEDQAYSDDDDESFEPPQQFDQRHIYQRQPVYPSPGNYTSRNHTPRNQMHMPAGDPNKYFQNTNNMDSYLDSTIHQMGLHNAYTDSYQVPPSMPSQNPSVTSILESFFETPAAPIPPNSSMSSPLSSQDDSSQNVSSPRPSYSSSTSFTNSTSPKGFLSRFRKSPAPAATPPNIVTTRPMAHRPNARRHELLSDRDVAEIREQTRTQQYEATLDPAVAAKDAVVKVAALSKVWCFRIHSQQPDDQSDPPVWTAFDYKHQGKLSKYAANNKEYMFRDSHLQGDVLILPAKGSGHVRGKTQARLEVRQLEIDPDTTFVYREGVKAKKWL